jgi:uncharacterized integral membrane protein
MNFAPWRAAWHSLRERAGFNSSGKWIILIGCTLATLFWILAFENTSASAVFTSFAAIFVRPLFLGGLVWVIGWIIEGFHSPPSRN